MSPIWANWAGDQRCAPQRIARPGTEQELAEIVAQAARDSAEVRVAGSGHSFTDCALTDGLMIDLARMDRVLDADPASGLVTVQAGITLRRLGRELAERGLALENQGDIDAQTLAGAISTATHGTGGRFANLSSRVVGMRIATAAGEVLELSEQDDPEALLAARVGVGALGAIAAVTLRCVPLFTLRRADEPRPLAPTLARLDELVDGAHHFELFAFPYTDLALTRTSQRSGRAPEPGNPALRWLREEALENGALGLAMRSARRFPRAIPRINRALAGAVTPSVKVDRSHRVFASQRRVRFTEMEYAIPRASAAEAAERVLALVERRRLPIPFPIELRVAAADDALLSTAHGRDTAYVAVHQYTGMEFEGYFRAVEAIMDGYGGRPHWGKRHYQSAATLRPRYPGWDRFQAVRARLDPGGAFTNDYTRRVLGPVAAP